mmetsp:Transcript_4087/g.16387  ORF Transcript_4087/g.16387 Transcript_4087/m.16387 type:complete len:231 (+) Transcript_4087:1013-1705(+)
MYSFSSASRLTAAWHPSLESFPQSSSHMLTYLAKPPMPYPCPTGLPGTATVRSSLQCFRVAGRSSASICVSGFMNIWSGSSTTRMTSSWMGGSAFCSQCVRPSGRFCCGYESRSFGAKTVVSPSRGWLMMSTRCLAASSGQSDTMRVKCPRWPTKRALPMSATLCQCWKGRQSVENTKCNLAAMTAPSSSEVVAPGKPSRDVSKRRSAMPATTRVSSASTSCRSRTLLMD